MVEPQPVPKALEQVFRLEVFKMLKEEGKIIGAMDQLTRTIKTDWKGKLNALQDQRLTFL